MLEEEKKRPSLLVRRLPAQDKLHTIHGLLRGRVFDGQFEVQAKTYRFSLAPTTASLADRKLVLSGRLSVTAPRQDARVADGVEARLLAVQGGVGVSPARRQLLSGTVQTSQTATSEQKMEQEKGPETDLQPGLHPFDSPRLDELGRPTVDSTGPLSFAGVLYFQLSPLAGPTLHVPLDLSKVQLNLRLAPTDDLARDLQNIFSNVADALYGDHKDERAAKEQVEELNRIFKS